MAGDSSSEYETKCEYHENRIGAHGSCEHEVEIHEESEERCDTRKEPDDEPEPDEHFTDGDHIRPGDEVGEDGAFKECGVPHLYIRVRAGGFPECALHEAVQRCPRSASEPCRVQYLFISGYEPFIAEVEAHDEPERSASRACSEEVGKKGLLDGVVVHSSILDQKIPSGSMGVEYGMECCLLCKPGEVIGLDMEARDAHLSQRFFERCYHAMRAGNIKNAFGIVRNFSSN